MSLRRSAAVLATLALVGGAATLSAGVASAATRPSVPRPASTGACPDGHAGCSDPGWFAVSGTDGSLSVQSTDAVNHIIGSVSEGAPVLVECQVNNGSTDPFDGLSSRTWDFVVAFYNGAWRTGWVYDWFVNTAPQDSNGWSVTTVC